MLIQHDPHAYYDGVDFVVCHKPLDISITDIVTSGDRIERVLIDVISSSGSLDPREYTIEGEEQDDSDSLFIRRRLIFSVPTNGNVQLLITRGDYKVLGTAFTVVGAIRRKRKLDAIEIFDTHDLSSDPPAPLKDSNTVLLEEIIVQNRQTHQTLLQMHLMYQKMCQILCAIMNENMRKTI